MAPVMGGEFQCPQLLRKSFLRTIGVRRRSAYTRSIFVEIQAATAVMMTRFLEATDAKCLRVDC